VPAALVTGAGSGIGAACAEALSAVEFGVVCADVDAEAADRMASRLGRAAAVALDVRSEADTESAVELAVDRFGPLEAVVTAAGILRAGPAIDLDLADFESVLAVNTTGSFLTARCAARAMMVSGSGGAIVLIGSMTSVAVSLPGQVAYATSKGAVLMLAKVLAVDLAPHGIRVNVVLPGITDTPFSRGALDDPEVRADALSRVPMGRPARPADIADAVAFLVSEEARYVTGAAFAVDGGQLAQISDFPWTA
jgi:NAD(P)-dependent dehydrogenase (short-subunit alcohol dehydrogenase family)